eukprot:363738-Chlamydomonas_euryale.AAC.8
MSIPPLPSSRAGPGRARQHAPHAHQCCTWAHAPLARERVPRLPQPRRRPAAARPRAAHNARSECV